MTLEILRSNKIHVAIGMLVLLAVVSGAYLAFADRTVEISNAEDLQSMNNDLDADYVLVDDIDASEMKNFEPIGDPSAREPFTGTFDGNGHTISNLTIHRPDKKGVGLFGYVDSENEGLYQPPQIVNVSLEGVDIIGGRYVGGLIGDNRGRVHESYVTGEISGESEVGGIVGWNDEQHHGSTGWVENSYAEVDVSGNESVGGSVGLNAGWVLSSYAAENMTGNVGVGGLVGRNRAGTVTDSYWDTDVTGRKSSAGGTGLTTNKMTGSSAPENMDGFDFNETWQTVTDPDGYPRLAWQTDG